MNKGACPVEAHLMNPNSLSKDHPLKTRLIVAAFMLAGLPSKAKVFHPS
jgi:hypothetical protein